MKFSTMSRTLGVVALTLMTQACLFAVDTNPGANNTSNNTNNTNNTNNVADPCLEVECLPGQVCEPSTGACGIVACNFTSEADAFQSTCPPDQVCQLNATGGGFCAPPCSSNSDCPNGSACDQKYGEVVGGGLCVVVSEEVNCDKPSYAGLCLSFESCFDGECFDDSAPACFARPDDSSPDDECELVLCDYGEVDSDVSCDFGSGAGPGIPALCHYNPNAFDFDPPATGYCDLPCGVDSDCAKPNTRCDLEEEGRCVADEVEQCPPGSFFDADDEQCKPYLCDMPGTEEGDSECQRRPNGVDSLVCGDSPFSNGSPGICHQDCNEEPCPQGEIELACEAATGRCMAPVGVVCPPECPSGRVCYEEEGGTCEAPTLNKSCVTGRGCSGDEVCLGVPVVGSVCVLACENGSECPVGAACVTVGGGTTDACAVKCTSNSDCGANQKCDMHPGPSGDSMVCMRD